MKIRLKNCRHSILAVVVGVALINVAHAQYMGDPVASPTRPANVSIKVIASETTDLHIMPGDVISIATYGAPELSTVSLVSSSNLTGGGTPATTGIKVSSQGEITLPYIGAIKVAGLTPPEAAAHISKLLKDGGFMTDPQVSVDLIDSPARVISVIGEVQKPTPISAFGRVRLLDAISACGGFTNLASHTVTVRRLGEREPIVVELGVNPKEAEMSNIALVPGDTIIVPRVANVYVMGQVKNSSAIPLAGNTTITVMRALALVGGVNFGAALSKARIIRTTSDNQHIEIPLDLKKIMYSKNEDVALMSDDILYVPTNSLKAGMAAGGAAVAASLLYGSAYLTSVMK